MVPPLSTSPTATLRIPPRRFLTQALISLLATLIPNILQHFDLRFLSFLVTFFGTAFAKLALRYHNPRAKLRSDASLFLISYPLGYLHQITTFIGTCSLYSAGSVVGSTRAQHVGSALLSCVHDYLVIRVPLHVLRGEGLQDVDDYGEGFMDGEH
ncbi:hypothetical protein BKA63DRAFT_565233 [Paraphoma chrysanthemicola]|nr:hypothetical protein BKA63DRAFT_565233 [Paraphoma chrysanthemicola]